MSLTWLAAAACVLLACELGALAHRRRWLLLTMVTAAVFQLVYGAQHWMSGSSSIWGVETGGNPTRMRGTFVNADHFAMYLEIIEHTVKFHISSIYAKLSATNRMEAVRMGLQLGLITL